LFRISALDLLNSRSPQSQCHGLEERKRKKIESLTRDGNKPPEAVEKEVRAGRRGAKIAEAEAGASRLETGDWRAERKKERKKEGKANNLMRTPGA
jgi:hypothetical protein